MPLVINENYSGWLFVFDGIDGVGKSTQAALLAQSLEGLGMTVHLRKEPTNGIYGQKLRDSAQTGRLAPEEELGLFLKDRQEHVEQVIFPALRRGEVVIVDRYYFSTMAYQSIRGFDVAEIREKNEAFAPKPDALFLLDLEVEAALERIAARGDIANAFEKAEDLRACQQVFRGLDDEWVHYIEPKGSVGETAHSILQLALQVIQAKS